MHVTGHSDHLGARSHNLELSRTRAESVAELIESHLQEPRVLITSESRGSNDPLPGLAPDAEENRRATIHISIATEPLE